MLKNNKKVFIWLALVCLVVYLQSLFFKYTYLDDNVLVLDNLFFLKNLSNLPKVFVTEVFHLLHSSAAYYRPVLTLSFMFDAIIGGGALWVFHATDIVIHVFVVWFLYLLLLRLKVSQKTAFYLSLFFAVHPALSQAVSWIPGRNDSLLALFVLGSLYFWDKYLQSLKIHDLLYYLLFFVLALFTKESALVLPFFYLGWWIWIHRANLRKTLPIIFLLWSVIGFVWFALRSIALGQNPVKYTLLEAVKTIGGNWQAIVLYFGKIFLPVNLSVLPTLVDSTLIFGIVSLVLFIILSLIRRPRNFWIYGLGWAIFLGFLLPGFIRPNTVYMPDFLEHRLYLPMIGILISLSQLLPDFKKGVGDGAAILAICIFGLINVVHSRVFSDSLPFWINAATNSPHHPLAHKNLGAMYYLNGQLDQAEGEFLKSLDLNKTEPMINNNLGLIYLDRGDDDLALKYFQKELELYPSYDNAHANLALLYYKEKKYDLAEAEWLTTVAINPDHKDALKYLAVYYAQVKKDPAKAQYFYVEATKRGVTF